LRYEKSIYPPPQNPCRTFGFSPHCLSPGGFPLEGRGVPPHYKVAQTVKDFMAGIDTQLEFALGLIQKGHD
jgi:hypothetical protein